MNHADHVHLLTNGIPQTDGHWAEFGSGSGAFTMALAELLGPAGKIFSIDKNARVLKRQQREIEKRFPSVFVTYHHADFCGEMPFLPELDGILMANSLHFIRHKIPLLKKIRGYMKGNGRFILIEYDTDRGNHWVPHPLSYQSWQAVAHLVGFTHTELLATRPSRFLGQFYAALSQ